MLRLFEAKSLHISQRKLIESTYSKFIIKIIWHSCRNSSNQNAYSQIRNILFSFSIFSSINYLKWIWSKDSVSSSTCNFRCHTYVSTKTGNAYISIFGSLREIIWNLTLFNTSDHKVYFCKPLLHWCDEFWFSVVQVCSKFITSKLFSIKNK